MNLAAVTIHGYVRPDPMTLDKDTFVRDIVQRGTFKIPCTILVPMYATPSASLDDQSMHNTVQNQWIRTNKNKLWMALLNIYSPTYSTDSTAAVREVRQGYSDEKITTLNPCPPRNTYPCS